MLLREETLSHKRDTRREIRTYHYGGPYKHLLEVHAALKQRLTANGHSIAGATSEIYLSFSTA